MQEGPEDSTVPEQVVQEDRTARCLVGTDGTVLRANSAWLAWAGLRSDEALGARLEELFPDTRDLILALLARASTGQGVVVPRHVQRLKGSDYWWSGTISPIPLRGATGLLVTVTEWSPADEELHRRAAAKALEDLLESERRWRALVEASEQIVWSGTGEGDLTLIGSGWQALTGQAPGASLGLGWLEAIRQEDRVKVAAAWQKAVTTGKAWDVEFRLQSQDGKWRDLRARGYPILRPDGSARQWVGVMVDVTEKKLAEQPIPTDRGVPEEVGRHRRWLDSISEATSDGVVVFGLDGRIEYVNEAEARKIGCSPAEAKAKALADFVAALELTHLDGSPIATGELPAFRVSRGETIRNLELRGRSHATGEERVFGFNGVPVLDEKGDQVSGLIVSRDITAAKGGMAGLHGDEEQLSSVAEQMPQQAWVADGSGRASWFNRRWLDYTGIPSEEAVRSGWHAFVHPDQAQQVGEQYRRCVDAAQPWEDTLRLKGANGEYRWFLCRASPVLDEHGRPVRWIGTQTDVTEQRRVEDELRESDRRKKEFLAVLSHELRNPLAPIRNSIVLLDKTAPGSPQAERARDVIQRQTEHLTRLVDDLLDVTRMTTGKVEVNLSRVDLREIVRRTCDDHRSLCMVRDVKLRLDLPYVPVWVNADPERTAQVVGNLLQNAAKFTPPGGSINVRVSTGEGYAETAVRDTGVGLEQAELDRLFEPFAQADAGPGRTPGGLGLGLALVKGLVELQGGSVRAHSEGSGRGSEFMVRLPLAPTVSKTEAPERARLVQASRFVLIIEDNLDAGQSLADILELGGHKVRLACDGKSGLALARELKPDVVICDIGLPDIDGYEIARVIRSDDAFRSMKLVALTGYAQPEDKQKAKAAGFDAHLPKPPPLDALNDLVMRS